MFTSATLAVALAVGAPALKDKEPPDKGPGYLGIAFQKDDAGLLVTEVRPDSPASKAGVKANDLIEKVEGVSTKDTETNEFVKMVGGMRPGSVVTLAVRRGSEALTIKVKLGARPADFTPTVPPPRVPPPDDPNQ